MNSLFIWSGRDRRLCPVIERSRCGMAIWLSRPDTAPTAAQRFTICG